MKTVKKKFIFEESVAKHLEELAKDEKKSISLLLQDMIEKAYSKIDKKKKLESAKKIIASSNGYYENLTIQEIKANQNV